MTFRRNAFLLSLFVALAGGHVLADDPAPQANSALDVGLKEIFRDDIQTDARKNYDVHGIVDWVKGLLTVSEKGAIGAEFDSGSWAQWQFELDWPALEKDGDQCATLLTIHFAEASDAAVGWVWKRRNGLTTGQLRILDSETQAGRTQFVLVREFPLQALTSHWKIQYRNGVISVESDKQRMGIAYLENGTATPHGWTLNGFERSVFVRGIQVEASTRRSPPSPEKAKLLAKADAQNKSGLAAWKQGDYEQAESNYLTSRDLRKRILGEDHLDYATSLNNLALLYTSMGKYAEAESLYVKALDIRQRGLGEEHPLCATTLNNLGGLYYTMGGHAKAEPLYVQALEIRKRVLGELHVGYATSLGNLADLYAQMGLYGKAESLHMLARDVWRSGQGEEHPNYATSLSNLAALYALTGEYAKAEPLMIRVLELRKRILGEKHPSFAISLNNLALLYKSMEEYAKAEPLYLQACDIRKQVVGEDHSDYAVSLSNLAGLYASMGEYAKALPLQQQANDVWKRTWGEEHAAYAVGLNNLALQHASLGENAQAETLYRQALSIRKLALGTDHPDTADTQYNLAFLYLSMSENAKAESLFQESLVSNVKSTETILAGLSEARAQEYVRAKVNGLAALLSNGRQLKGYSRRAAYLAVWQTQGLVSRTLRERRRTLGDDPEARKLREQLQVTQQQLAQWTLLTPGAAQRDQRQKRLQELVDEKERQEFALAKASEAFRQSKMIAQCGPDDLMRVIPDGTAVVHFLKTTIWEPSAPGKGLREPVANYEAFVLTKEAVIREPSSNGVPYTVSWIHLGSAELIDSALTEWRRRMQRAVGRGLRLEPSKLPTGESPEDVLRRRIWLQIEPQFEGCKRVIVIPDGDLHFLPWAALPGGLPGTYLIEEYAIATAQDGRQLYLTLTAPPLTGDPSLLLVGGVDYDRGEARPTAPLRELARTINVQTDEPNSRTSALSKRPVWPALPGSAVEIEQLAKLAGSRTVTTLCGSEAQENTLRQKMPRARFIHLATHGFFADETFRSAFGQDEAGEQLFGGTSNLVTQKRAGVTYRNPLLLSGIVLAGANQPPQVDRLGLETGQDGILTAEEAVNLDLRLTELVVLSACETGLGRVGGGEGVFGLQRAFAMSGARTTVTALWKVDDDATQAMMTEFYRNLWEKKLPKLEALRQAQLTMLRRYEPTNKQLRGLNLDAKPNLKTIESETVALPPYFWAAFTLSGDWR